MGVAAAVATAEARQGCETLGRLQPASPAMFQADGRMADPGPQGSQAGAQIVDVPVVALGRAKMARHARPHPARPKGAANVNVIARRCLDCAPAAYLHNLSLRTFQHEGIGSGIIAVLSLPMVPLFPISPSMLCTTAKVTICYSGKEVTFAVVPFFSIDQPRPERQAGQGTDPNRRESPSPRGSCVPASSLCIARAVYFVPLPWASKVMTAVKNPPSTGR
jgi:hypothetical protein